MYHTTVYQQVAGENDRMIDAYPLFEIFFSEIVILAVSGCFCCFKCRRSKWSGRVAHKNTTISRSSATAKLWLMQVGGYSATPYVSTMYKPHEAQRCILSLLLPALFMSGDTDWYQKHRPSVLSPWKQHEVGWRAVSEGWKRAREWLEPTFFMPV